MGEKAVAANFAKFDHEAIAHALGCDGVRVSSTSELRAAIESVSKLTRPLVIDVPLSLETSFQDVSQTFDAH
jgi:thiamine pyrophosphate-dependent acetolactate synthase large subunit-like protein